jgi:hypothetical protein
VIKASELVQTPANTRKRIVMIRNLIQCAFVFVLCPFLAAQQMPATAGDCANSQTLPDNPQPTRGDRSGWNRVRAFSQGDKIAVTTSSGETYRCTVTVPSEVSLACSYLRGRPSGEDYEFTRDEILEIRQRHPGRDIAIATGVVTTLAFVGGGRQGGSSFDLNLAGISALVAWGISTPLIVPLVENSPGHLIYRKPGSRVDWFRWRPAPMGIPPFFPPARRF